MGKLVSGDDGLKAEEVGEWVEDKLFDVRTYVEVTSPTRRKYLPPRPGGATYTELFCGPGRSRIRDTGRFVEGTAVAAWNCSVANDTPFTGVYIADKDEERRELCAERLRRLNAPVHEIKGDALTAARELGSRLPQYGLHFAFLDPYNLGALDADIISSLGSLKRMDILVHLSAMDLFRNIESQTADGPENEWDAFAPGWSAQVPRDLPQAERRDRLLAYWIWYVKCRDGFDTASDMHPVYNSVNRLLYWLTLLHRHPLPARFWRIVLKSRPQRTGELF
jgi:three-Cys-motif partner protein